MPAVKPHSPSSTACHDLCGAATVHIISIDQAHLCLCGYCTGEKAGVAARRRSQASELSGVSSPHTCAPEIGWPTSRASCMTRRTRWDPPRIGHQCTFVSEKSRRSRSVIVLRRRCNRSIFVGLHKPRKGLRWISIPEQSRRPWPRTVHLNARRAADRRIILSARKREKVLSLVRV